MNQRKPSRIMENGRREINRRTGEEEQQENGRRGITGEGE